MYLLPPDLRDWLPEDDLAHFVVEAVERVPLERFQVNERGTGSAQYHPRMMLALLVYCYANGIFGSRRIERVEYERKVAARKRRTGSRKGWHITPPTATPEAKAQISLTDADSALMRKSRRHEYRQAYNAQAVVDADGSQLVLGSLSSGQILPVFSLFSPCSAGASPISVQRAVSPRTASGRPSRGVTTSIFF